MASAKLLLLVAITATFSMAASAGLRDSFAAKNITDNYKTTNSKEVYRFTFNDEDGSSREEIGTIVNPGTPEEYLVVVGSYTVIDRTDYKNRFDGAGTLDGSSEGQNLSGAALKGAGG